MQVVVAYDVVEDKRRAKLARALTGFIGRVQKSVFEGWVPNARMPQLIEAIHEHIDHQTDNVRIYHQCAYCRGQLLVVGTATTALAQPDDEVI